MDTKEKNRHLSRSKRPASGRKPTRKAAASAPAKSGRRRAVKRTQVPRRQEKRVIHAPRDQVPRVVYTAPKPLRKGRFLLKLMTMAAVVAAVFMALSVFFRVETIMVAGAVKYTPWMVREASGIEAGDSLLELSEGRIASRITDDLPYVDKVKVDITLPGTVTIEITELQVTYAIQDSLGGWWLISSGGRVVEQTTAASAGSYTRIQGLKLDKPKVDTTVRAAAEQTGETAPPTEGTNPTNPVPITDQQTADTKLQSLLTILTELENGRIIGEVSIIDLTDPQDMRLEFGQRLVVRLGDNQRLAYKVAYMAAALEQMEENVSGDLDLTLEYTEEALFTPAG